MTTIDFIEEAGVPKDPEPAALTVRLIKPFSWKDSFSKYPALLAAADPHRVYSTTELYEGVLRARVPRQGDPLQWTLAFVGLEPDIAANACQVRGLAFAQLTPETVGAGGRGLHGCYLITETGRRLGAAYRDDPNGPAWRRIFAEAVARRDPYTRVLLGALGSGALLRFPADPGPNGFGKQTGMSELRLGDGWIKPLAGSRRRVKPAKEKDQAPPEKVDKASHPFVRLMREHPRETVGPFLLADMAAYGLDISQKVQIAGAWQAPGRGMRPDPSVNEIDLYLHQSLALFVEIGVIVYRAAEQAWSVDAARARAVLPADLCDDLFPASDDMAAFLEALEYAYADLPKSHGGLVEVRALRRRVGEVLGVPPGEQEAHFNRQIAALWGRIGVGRTLGHTAPPHDCLFADPGKQYVELLF